MQLCEHGCGSESLLIVAGPFKGRVIDNMAAAISPPDGAEATFVAGSGQTAHRLPTFFEWLDDWMDTSIKDVAQMRLRRIGRGRSPGDPQRK